MSYASWEPRYRVTTIAPGKLDLFVLTLVDGVRAAIDPIHEYDAALSKARQVHGGRAHNIKVLPLSGRELFNLLGIRRPVEPEPEDPILRREMVTRLWEIARDSNDPDARRDAFDLLTEMGEIKQ